MDTHDYKNISLFKISVRLIRLVDIDKNCNETIRFPKHPILRVLNSKYFDTKEKRIKSSRFNTHTHTHKDFLLVLNRVLVKKMISST